MATQFLLEAPIALIPVLAFLGTLLYFDSYRLVSAGEMAQTMIGGLLLAVAAYFANGYLMQRLAMEYGLYSHFVGPAVEELLKALAIILLFARNRIGFMIDAAIMGFAVGTGFGVFENVYFLYSFQDADIGVWIIRGFGTAIMHGGATAVFAMLAESLFERRGSFNPLYFAPALLAAVVVHVLYNLLTGIPMLATLAVLIGLPPIFLLIFTKSEHAVHQWLVHDYASHQQLIDDIESGAFLHTEAGRFILTLSKKFDKSVVDDIFEYLKLHAIAVLRAEAKTLARERNEKIVHDPQDHEILLKLDALAKRIGRGVLMVLWPHLHFSRRELWELHQLTG